MKQEIAVPRMGESISEATIGQILKPSGSLVKAEEEILELETDKVNQILYAPAAGVLTVSVKSGDRVKIGQVIGVVEAKEGVSTTAPQVQPAAEPKKAVDVKETQPPMAPQTSVRETKAQYLADLAPQPEPVAPSQLPAQPIQPSPFIQEGVAKLQFGAKSAVLPSDSSSSQIAYSQSSMSICDEVEPLAKSSNLASKASFATPSQEERETRQKMSRIRRVIAQRLVEAQQTTAMLTTFNEVDMGTVIELRSKHKEAFIKRYGVKLGFMPFFVTAVVSALKTYPELNSYIQGDEIVHREYYDLGIAVGTDRGLFVPVVRQCDQLTFGQIEQAIDLLAKKARDGTLQVDDLTGGGFTITNGGVYGSLLSTPILTPPQSGILGMHKIQQRPVAIQNNVEVRSMMYLALSYDHRIVDGKGAVGFLVHVKECLEDPARLLIEI